MNRIEKLKNWAKTNKVLLTTAAVGVTIGATVTYILANKEEAKNYDTVYYPDETLTGWLARQQENNNAVLALADGRLAALPDHTRLDVLGSVVEN